MQGRREVGEALFPVLFFFLHLELGKGFWCRGHFSLGWDGVGGITIAFLDITFLSRPERLPRLSFLFVAYSFESATMYTSLHPLELEVIDERDTGR